MPSSVVARDLAFGVSPAEMNIRHMRPGEAVDFELTVRNQDDVSHVFTIATHHPPEDERRPGRAALPDEGWVSFLPDRSELPAGSAANVTVKVAIPPEKEWEGRDWEIWLGVAPESTDMLAAELYVRLLVSTQPAAATGTDMLLSVVVAAGAVLAGWATWYCLKGKRRPT